MILALLRSSLSALATRHALVFENLALRQQLALVTHRNHKRLRFHRRDRLFWVWLYRIWPDCLQTLVVFKPDTLVRWHREVFVANSYTGKKSATSQSCPGGCPALNSGE